MISRVTETPLITIGVLKKWQTSVADTTMGDSVEDLLAQLKAQYGETDRSGASLPSDAKQPPTSNVPPSPPASSQPSGLRPPQSVEDLLTHLEGKTPTRSQFSPASSPGTDAPPPMLPIEFLPSVTHSTDRENQTGKQADTESNKIYPSNASTNHLLNDLKAQHQERKREEQLKQQAQQREEQRRQEALKREEQCRQEALRRQQAEQRRQRSIAVMQQAEEWLKRLDPYSGEASWFEEFAAKYESRLEAAIDYLGLMEE